MNLDQLEAINAVVEKGSFRAAAESLNRSQPALSATIKNLEEEFGLLIFDRSEYRPKLTEAGAAFLNVARKTLETARYTSRVGFELGQKKAETKLVVSMDPLISIEVIELLTQECGRPVLPVNLILEKSILTGSHQDLLDGRIDLAIAACPHDEEKIEKIFLETVTLVGAVSRKLLQEKRQATESFLAQNPQILTYDRRFDEPDGEFMAHPISDGVGPKIFAPDHFTKRKLIENGMGWGRISKTEFENGKDLVLIDKTLCAPVSLELCLLRAKHRALGPVAQSIWKVFQNRR
jgi:DNA-binding transcriptional LysR family regulator